MKFYVVVGRNLERELEWKVWSSYLAADRLGVRPCVEGVAIYTDMTIPQREEWLRDTGAGYEWKIVEVEWDDEED